MTYVDERIVDMRFDNKQFEQNAAETMSTLDKLKEKLQFKNASSGADQLQKAIEKINTSPILSGIGAIETRMSALSIAGKRVVEDLVDVALSGVNKIRQKLQVPINQIITGGKTRAQNIEQAKFQLQGLGVAWEDIQEDINYGVQDTAYGLDAAAKVASQLVASQVQIGDDMKHALLGISGLAAMTNSSYEDIGRIFTTVAGNGRLMGDQLLQLSSRGINAAATLGKALGKTESEIREMVSKGQISFQMFSEAMWEAFGEHAKEANKTFQGALSNTKAALSRLGADVAAQGFNTIRDILNEIIPKLKELKKKLKPVEDSINRMIESVGKLIQTFIKSIDVVGIVNKIAPKIQAITEAIADFADAYNMIFNEKTIKNTTAFLEEQKGLKNLEDQSKSTGEALTDLSKISEDQIAKAKAIWEEGAFGTGEARREALGKDYEMVQAYIDKMIELGWDEAKMQEHLTKTAQEQEEAEKDLVKVAKKRQIIETITKILGNLKHVAENVFNSVKNVLTVLFDAFGKSFNAKDFGGGLINFTAYLAEISDKLFISGERAEKLRPIFEALFTVVKAGGKLFIALAKGASMAITKIAEIINKLKNNVTFQNFVKGVKDGLTNIWDSIKNSYEKLKSAGIIDSILSSLGRLLEFLGTTLTVGLQGVSTLVGGIIDGLGTGLGALIDSASTLFSDIIKGVEGPVKSLFDLFKSIIEMVSVKNLVKAGGLALIIKFVWDIYTLISSVLHIAVNVAKFGDAVTGLLGTLRDMFKANVRRMDVETIAIFINSMVKVIWAILALTVVMAVVPNADKMAWQAFAIVGIITALYGAIDIISKETKSSSKSLGSINITLANAKIQMGIFLAGMAAMLYVIINSIKTLYDIINNKNYNLTAFLTSIFWIVDIIIGLIAAMTILINKTQNEGKTPPLIRLALLFVAFAFSVKMIISAISKIYEVVKTDSSIGRFLIVSAVIAALYGLAYLMSNSLIKNENIKNINKISIFLVAFAFSIKIITSALGQLIGAIHDIGDEASIKQATKSIVIITAVIGALLIAIIALSKNTTDILEGSGKIGIGLLKAKASGSSTSKTSSGFGPLFGVAAIMFSFAYMLKSIVPAIEAIGKVYKDLGYEKASASLWGLIRILGIVGLLVVAIEGLMSLTKDNNLLANVGVSILILSMSHLVKSLSESIAMLSKAADVSTIKTIATTIGIFISALILIAAISAKILNGDGALAMLTIATLIISIGASMYLAAQGFKALETALVDLVTSLPDMIDSLLSFFEKIHNNAETIKQGIIETVSLMIEGAVAGFVAGFAAFSEAIPEITDGILNAIVVAVNSAADSLIEITPKLKDALNHLKYAMAYAFAYGLFGKNEDSAWGMFTDTAKAYINDEILKALTPGKDSTVGKADWYEKELEEMKKKAEGTAKKEGTSAGTTVGGNYYNAYYTAQAKEAEKAKKEAEGGLSLTSILGEENVDKLSNSKVGKAVEKFTGKSVTDIQKTADSYVTDIQETVKSINYEDIINNNISKVSSATGFSWGENTMEGYMNAVENGGVEAGQEYLDMYGNLDEINLDYADDMNEWGTTGFTNYTEGVQSKKDAVVEASKEIQDASIELINSYQPAYYKAGRYLTMGLALGIVDGDMKKITLDNMADVVTALKIKAASELDENSPSKVFYKMGEYITVGLAQGILSLAGMAENATEDIGEDTIGALKSVIQRIYDKTFEDMDANPVITPVLDLSQLEAGLMQMDSMFASRRSYNIVNDAKNAFNDNLASRNAMDIQNTYDDTNVVNAIGELRTDVDTMIGIVGNLGFYIDGRQVASAIANPMQKELHDISVQTGRGVR